MPQPYFVPVSPIRSRSTHSSGSSESAVTVWFVPLTLSVYVRDSAMPLRSVGGPGLRGSQRTRTHSRLAVGESIGGLGTSQRMTYAVSAAEAVTWSGHAAVVAPNALPQDLVH